MKALALLFPLSLAAQLPLGLTTWHNDGSLFGSTVRVSYANEAFRTVQAGQIRATSPGESWITYCTDLNNVLAAGLFSPIPLPLATDAATQNPDWVVGGIVRATQAVAYYGGQINTAREAVALQAMVWELLYDTSADLASGSFRAQDGAVSGATSLTSLWLQQSEWTQVDTSAAQWFQPVNYLGEYRPAQGLIGHVPEPSTWAAGAALLAVVGLIAVKRGGAQ